MRRFPQFASAVGLTLFGSFAVSTPATAADVEVTGGKEANNVRRFVWKVTNNGSKPITTFKALHYGSNDTLAPDGWKATEMTGNVRYEAAKLGHIQWAAETPAAAIRRGESLEFAIALTPAGIHETKRTVVVGFADGTQLEIPGVRCPDKEPLLQKHFPAIGLGAIFLLILGGRALLKKKTPQSTPAESEDG